MGDLCCVAGLEAEEKDYQSQLEEIDRSAQSEYESSLAELESVAVSAEEEIKDKQQAEEAAADASLGGIIRAEELSDKRKQLEEDSTALVSPLFSSPSPSLALFTVLVKTHVERTGLV